jgi:predicted DNA-binding protein YlxM (UPF0122 family)
MENLTVTQLLNDLNELIERDYENALTLLEEFKKETELMSELNAKLDADTCISDLEEISSI